MVILKTSYHSECIVRLALEAALQPEFQDLRVVCQDGVLRVSSFIFGALRYGLHDQVLNLFLT